MRMRMAVLELGQLLVVFLAVDIFDKDLCLILDKDPDKIGKPLTLSYVMS